MIVEDWKEMNVYVTVLMARKTRIESYLKFMENKKYDYFYVT